jgi:hypothetical protein
MKAEIPHPEFPAKKCFQRSSAIFQLHFQQNSSPVVNYF